MQKTSLLNAIAACLILTSVGVSAALPSMSKLPWIGYFMATKEKKYQITMTTAGTAKLEMLNAQGNTGHSAKSITMSFFIIETLPDGKTVNRAIIPDSLTSDQPAEIDPKKPMVFRGKVKGDASFEAIYYPERGGYSFGGKVIDKGTLTNPLSFAVRADFAPYHFKGDDISDTEKLAKKDNIRFETTQRKREKLGFLDEKSSTSALPDAITNAEIATEGYSGLGFKLISSSGTSFSLSSRNEKRLLEGFGILWRTDPKAGNSPQKISFLAK
jgi:hypothetical protein